MKTIFVMVKCDLGRAYKVAEEAVESVEEVSEVYSVSGQYDLLMKCYLPPAMDIGHFVVERLQTLPGINDTFTIMAYKAFSEDKSYCSTGVGRRLFRIVSGGVSCRFSIALAFLSNVSASRASLTPDSLASASPRRSSARLRRNAGSTFPPMAVASDRKVSPAHRGAIQATRALRLPKRSLTRVMTSPRARGSSSLSLAPPEEISKRMQSRRRPDVVSSCADQRPPWRLWRRCSAGIAASPGAGDTLPTPSGGSMVLLLPGQPHHTSPASAPWRFFLNF